MSLNLNASALIHKPTESALSDNSKIEIKKPKDGLLASIVITLILLILLFAVSAAIVYFIYGRYNSPPDIVSPLP